MIDYKTHRFILYPGFVISKYDGEKHYIDAFKLAHLYGVNIRNCLIVREDNVPLRSIPNIKDIYLIPQSDGNYDIRRYFNHD